MADGAILPKTAEGDIAEAVLEALRADPDVRSIFGHPARIYDDETKRPIHPYAMLQRHETRPADVTEFSATEHIITVAVTSRFGGRRYARDALGALRAAVERSDFSPSGQRIVFAYTTYGDVFRTQDRKTFRGLLRIRIISEEAA
ncbi:MAG: DUF3168 domain-containing protein [Pseudomonadota bacterium]